MMTKKSGLKRWALTALAAGFATLGLAEQAQAQEILLTGPLAGAPAVRKLRLYRQGRFEIAPGAAFTLLDEYRRTIFFGARLNYNLTEWLAIGAWGGGGVIKIPTALTDHIQDVNKKRKELPQNKDTPTDNDTLDHRLTRINIGSDFKDQLSNMDWVVSPQITLVPFRGKLALFQSIYADTDLYFFGGPAFVGLKERGNCESACSNSFTMASRMAIAPTFGLGFSFYMSKWAALGFEWRGLPFSLNNSGFDTAGGNRDNLFPDNKITSADQQFHFNQMLNVSFNFYLPTQYKVGE